MNEISEEDHGVVQRANTNNQEDPPQISQHREDANRPPSIIEIKTKERNQMILHLKNIIYLEKAFLIHCSISAVICLSVKLGCFSISPSVQQVNDNQNLKYSSQNAEQSLSSASEFSLTDYFIFSFIQNLLCLYLIPQIIKRDNKILLVIRSKLIQSNNEPQSIEEEDQNSFEQSVKSEVEVLEQGIMKRFTYSKLDKIAFAQVLESFIRTESFGPKLIVVVSTIALLGFNIGSFSLGVIDQEIENYIVGFLAIPALIMVVPSFLQLIFFLFSLIGITIYFTYVFSKMSFAIFANEIEILKRKLKVKKPKSKVEELTCPICISDFNESSYPIGVLPCSHTFHLKCIQMWIKEANHCPLCRKLI